MGTSLLHSRMARYVLHETDVCANGLIVHVSDASAAITWYESAIRPVKTVHDRDRVLV